MVLFGQPVSDPIALLGRVEGAWGIAAALVGLSLATLTTNLAANVVAPANAAVAAAPGRVSFVGGALLTSVLGAAVKPWRLIESTSAFYSWLVRARVTACGDPSRDVLRCALRAPAQPPCTPMSTIALAPQPPAHPTPPTPDRVQRGAGPHRRDLAGGLLRPEGPPPGPGRAVQAGRGAGWRRRLVPAGVQEV